MSVDLLHLDSEDATKACTILPNWINWREGLKWERKWRTAITGGVTGAEDRSTGAPATPLHKIQHLTSALDLAEGARLRARILDGLKRGRVVCPQHYRKQYITDAAHVPGDQFRTTATIDGLWSPVDLDYAFFLRDRPASLEFGHENKSFFVNCGGDAVVNTFPAPYHDWIADAYYDSGDVAVVAEAVDTVYLQAPVPPQEVLQSLRGNITSDPIIYTFEKLHAGIECRIRMIFVAIEGFPGFQNVDVIGDETVSFTHFSPYEDAGDNWNVAIPKTAVVRPDKDGTIRIQVSSASALHQIRAIELWQNLWEIKQLTADIAGGILTFDDFIQGVYTAVYPCLFGRLSVDDMSQITDRIGEIVLTIEEPLGTGTAGVAGSCPAEVCFDDGANSVTWGDGGETSGTPPEPGAQFGAIYYTNPFQPCSSTINSFDFADLVASDGGEEVRCRMLKQITTPRTVPKTSEVRVLFFWFTEQFLITTIPEMDDLNFALNHTRRYLDEETGSCNLNNTTDDFIADYNWIKGGLNSPDGGTGTANDPIRFHIAAS